MICSVSFVLSSSFTPCCHSCSASTLIFPQMYQNLPSHDHSPPNRLHLEIEKRFLKKEGKWGEDIYLREEEILIDKESDEEERKGDDVISEIQFYASVKFKIYFRTRWKETPDSLSLSSHPKHFNQIADSFARILIGILRALMQFRLQSWSHLRESKLDVIPTSARFPPFWLNTTFWRVNWISFTITWCEEREMGLGRGNGNRVQAPESNRLKISGRTK